MTAISMIRVFRVVSGVAFLILIVGTRAQTPTVTAHYRYDGRVVLQDRSATPGAVLTTDKEKVCQPGYAKTLPEVPESERQQAFAAYGVKPSTRTVNGKIIPVCCQADRIISAKLGGSNDIKNVWPQPYYPKPGAHEKDLLEDWLLKQVCSGAIPLEKAQQDIARNWYALYKQMH